MDIKLDVAVRPDIAERIPSLVGKLRIVDTQQILVVVDDGIGLVPSPGAFGIGRVIQIIDSLDFVFARTRITIASRQGPVAKLSLSGDARLQNPTYTGFRFDRTEPAGGRTLDLFDQVWCFGLNPLIHDPVAASDASIVPIAAGEADALRSWMDAGGGVLAMGDHGLLGADMCSAIPRVRLMRRWTDANGVPDREGTNRLDTHRPATAAQTYHPVSNPTPSEIPATAQTDSVPQEIEWVPDRSVRHGLFVRERPHPILCHPTLGPIDVFPDHAHEGRCFDSQAETLVDPDGDFSSAGAPPPVTIAYGHTLPDPPWDHAKNAQPARRFPLITVYDGQRAGDGRIVVDSTWHHWMDLNIWELESENGDEWAKIRRYFENVAIWLARPSWRSKMLWIHLSTLKWSYLAVQEIDLTMPTRTLGRALLDHLRPRLGPCWVTHLLYDIIPDFEWREMIVPDFPDPCLSCPPLWLIEEYLYGAIARASLEHAAKLKVGLRAEKLTAADLRVPDLAKALPAALRSGLTELVQVYRDDLRHATESVGLMARVAGCD